MEQRRSCARGSVSFISKGAVSMKKFLARFVNDTEGQDLIEYALLAAIIALGVTAAMSGVKTALSGQFNAISSSVATGS
jgi:pilus assembly protein Flp/PilA